MEYTIELNNARNDADFDNGQIKRSGALYKTYEALVNGKDMESVANELCSSKKITKEEATAQVNNSVERIKNKNMMAGQGDAASASELNTLRKLMIQPVLEQDMRLLGLFGNYERLGWDETPEFDYYQHIGLEAVEQAEGVTVPFGSLKKANKKLATQIVSGGYVINYRKAALGDLSKENEGMEQVRTMIRNKALAQVLNTVIDALQNAPGIKYQFSGAGLTKAGVDDVLAKVRRFGRPTVVADTAMLQEFSAWAGYVGTISNNTILGVAQSVLEELARDGQLSMYNGAILSEMPNPYNMNALNAAGTNFKVMLPAQYGFVLPAGSASPIHTFTRGDITSFVGNDVTHGDIITRFDLEVAAGVEPGNEYKIGLLEDTNLATL